MTVTPDVCADNLLLDIKPMSFGEENIARRIPQVIPYIVAMVEHMCRRDELHYRVPSFDVITNLEINIVADAVDFFYVVYVIIMYAV